MMPVETTENYVRIRVKDPDSFSRLRTITLSESEGIKAIVGRLHGDKTTTIQAYLFARDKGWNEAKARKWVSEHKKSSGAKALNMRKQSNSPISKIWRF
jgi:hypothetical protein